MTSRTIGLLVLLSQAATAGAQSPPTAAAPNTNAFRITQSVEAQGQTRLGHRSVIDYLGVKYTALMPPAYRIQTSQEQKRVVGYGSDDSCSLTLAFWPGAKLGKDQKFDHEFLRWWVSQQSGDGKILSETWSFTLGARSPTFDVLWKTKAGVSRRTRITFISLPGTIIEASILSEPEKFDVNSFAHSDLLGSLRKSDQDGKLEINPLSNKF